MSENNSSPQNEQPKGLIRRFIALPADSIPKTLFVAVTLCLCASMVVSVAAVSLRPLQEENRLRDKRVNILQVAGLYDPNADVAEAFKAFEPQILDLRTGKFTDEFDPTTFDDKASAEDANQSRELEEDPAGIGRQSYYKTIYLLRDDSGGLSKVILPIHGYGLWSTLYGFVALEPDGNEIFGLQFYQHAETPGLGAEVDNPRWKALWRGKKLRDEDGVLQITVDKTAPAAGDDYFVDGLAGATLTSVGVDNLVKFWMGKEGYEEFLSRLNSGETI
ncbi:MAG: Na(+)-translocating NADH-quinone reductase subunit C [Pseudomonadota bacterium]